MRRVPIIGNGRATQRPPAGIPREAEWILALATQREAGVGFTGWWRRNERLPIAPTTPSAQRRDRVGGRKDRVQARHGVERELAETGERQRNSGDSRREPSARSDRTTRRTPFFQCTVSAATIITDSMSAEPMGPRKPNAIEDAAHELGSASREREERPGRKPSISKNPAVPASPWPPNQPKSFCDA